MLIFPVANLKNCLNALLLYISKSIKLTNYERQIVYNWQWL